MFKYIHIVISVCLNTEKFLFLWPKPGSVLLSRPSVRNCRLIHSVYEFMMMMIIIIIIIIIIIC